VPLYQTCLSLVGKYGPVAKVVATSVLNVVAPGSDKLIELVGQAIEAVSESADRSLREDCEQELRDRLKQNEVELARLGQLMEALTGPLAEVCERAAASAHQIERLPDIVSEAIGQDPSLARVLHQIGMIKEQVGVFQADMRRLADRQDEAAPVFVRMNRVAEYFEEMRQAGIQPKDFARLMHAYRQVVAHIQHGQPQGLDVLIQDMRAATPNAVTIPVLEAAAAVRDFNYPQAQRALKTALRLKPGDRELSELSQRVTVLETRSTPKQPRPTVAKEMPRLQPGDTLDGWQLEERLGAGGWGQVFRAVRDGQTRALKVMHPDLAADRPFVERFTKEIATLQRLPRHPNLVRIDSFGYCPERKTWYLALEYVGGPTLESYLAKKGPLTEAQVLKVFTDVIDGLAQAHAAGIVHRDIKPSNLIFRGENDDEPLVLVDFGLAVYVEEVGHTRLGGLTLHFAAPEQLYGGPATQASDVFSLCAVIHYALNYDKPEQRKPICFSASMAPESLRAALTRGLAVNVAERLADAGQLRQAFQPQAPPPVANVGPAKQPSRLSNPSWPDIEADFDLYQEFIQRGVGTKAWLQKRVARLPRWKEAAALQVAKAMVLLGDCYEEGVGVAQDYAEAMKWYRKAADAGNAVAMYSIGWLYRHGLGVAQDYAEAMTWYRKAADADNAAAMNNIGCLYHDGLGVAQDYAEAMKWYRKAADAGNAGAMYNIGWLYQDGLGVAQDYAKAMTWYRKAADAGNTDAIDAMHKIGILYRNDM
jgi:hypothetical protein